jgi:uncharacterized membrane protein YfcA
MLLKYMDRQTLALILGICCIAIGVYMAFAKKHYSSETWKPTELSERLFGKKRVAGLVRFQGILIFFMGLFFLLEWFAHEVL